MKWMTYLVALLTVAIAGCATPYSVPKEYTGPTVELSDSVIRESPGVLRAYGATAFDGKSLFNAIGVSAQRSAGNTFGLLEASVTRQVEVKPVKVHLQAQHMAAPIAGFALLAQGKFYYTHRGVVDFSPKSGHKYQVKGSMDAEEIAVWIEDVETGERVTEKVAKKPGS